VAGLGWLVAELGWLVAELGWLVAGLGWLVAELAGVFVVAGWGAPCAPIGGGD
jgi:hypothetical protein